MHQDGVCSGWDGRAGEPVFKSEQPRVIEVDAPALLFLSPGVWNHYRPVGAGKGWMTAHRLAVCIQIAIALTNSLQSRAFFLRDVG